MPSSAASLVRSLESRRLRLVLAESCTGGLVSAELAKVPGVSQWFCGSAVTYRSETKSAWLGVREEAIARHTAVSREVAEAMVRGVLERTPEADLAAAITGHLGPQAPDGFDGKVFIGTGNRGGHDILVTQLQLTTTSRLDRQMEAAAAVLAELQSRIDAT